MTKYLTPSTILALIVVGWFWLQARDARIRAETLAEARADSLQAALVVGDSLVGELLERDTALKRQADSLTVRLDAERAAFTRLRIRNQAQSGKLDSLLAALPDSSPLPALVDTLQAEAQACHSALGACDSVRVILLARVALRDSIIAVRDTALATTREFWEEAEQRSRPRKWGIGCAGGYGAVSSGGELKTGLGVLCGLVVRF
jgi:hypothetical protein